MMQKDIVDQLARPYGVESMSILHRKLQIVKPDMILFVTGPYYTYSMSAALNVDEDEFPKYRPCKNSSCRDLTSIVPFDIPTFWSYHPRYLSSIKALDKVVEQIVSK